MKKVRNKGAPLVAMFVLMVGLFALSGCLSAYEYDPNSHTHAMQSDRNVDDINNGLDDAAIDEKIEEAWRVAHPEPEFQAEGMPDGTASAEWQAWKMLYDERFSAFAEPLWEYAVTDIERTIDKDQSGSWVDYEDAKRPEGTDPPILED